MTTCLGLNGWISLAAALGVEVTSLEPKMPFSRYTANPATAMTRTATRSIHRRNSRLPSEARCIRGLSTSGDRLRTADIPGPGISTWLTLRYEIGPHNPGGYPPRIAAASGRSWLWARAVVGVA